MPAKKKKKKDDRSPKALEAVAELFKKKPGAPNSEFREAAEKADPSIANIGGRSFNAKYVLPFKRSAASVSGKGKRAARKAADRVTSRAQKKAKKKATRKKKTKRAKRRTSKKKTTRRKRTKATAARSAATALADANVSAADAQKLRDLVAARDREAMAAVSDPRKAYQLAASMDEFLSKVVGLVS